MCLVTILGLSAVIGVLLLKVFHPVIARRLAARDIADRRARARGDFEETP